MGGPEVKLYGKAIAKLANQWHKQGYVDADARKAAYLAERAAAYARICQGYAATNQPHPPPTVLSGEVDSK